MSDFFEVRDFFLFKQSCITALANDNCPNTEETMRCYGLELYLLALNLNAFIIQL